MLFDLRAHAAYFRTLRLHRHGRGLEVPASPYGLVVSLTRPRGPRSIGVLPTLAEDLLDVVGRPYDGVDYVVLDDVRETMLDPAKSDHPLATVGVVAQTPCDVAANLNLHSGLAEVDIAVVAQLKAHHVLHDPVKPLRIADKKVRRSEAIREVGEDGQGERACCWISEHFSPARRGTSGSSGGAEPQINATIGPDGFCSAYQGQRATTIHYRD